MSWTEIKVRKPGTGRSNWRRWEHSYNQGWEIEGLTHARWMIVLGFVHVDDLRSLHAAGRTTWVTVRVVEDYARWLTLADEAMRTGGRIPTLPRPRLDRGTPARMVGEGASIVSGVLGGKGAFVRVPKVPR